MSSLEQKAKFKPSSKKQNNRFYTKLDMAIIKHDTMIKNSQIKRGERKPGNGEIYICGCGVEGCFIHS